MRQPGRRADVQHRAHSVAQRRPAARGRGHDRRQPVRLVTAGDESRRVHGASRCRRRCAVLRDRVDEPRAARRGDPRRVRTPDTEVVLRALRSDQPVRRGRAHRREVGRHSRRLRSVRPRIATARATRMGGRAFRARSAPDRRARRRRGRQAHRHDASCSARRGPARDVTGSARQAEARRTRERRAHRGFVLADHRRRGRGADDDRGPRPGARRADRAPGSSISASSASTRC